ncbi:DPY30 domain-containing protein 2 isoform X2 [Marmota monax]|nr:DPY30 domain-containing protein 2 isoform X2 [Marmota monax]
MREQIQLMEEYENSLKEKEMAAMLKQEELQIQQKCEECHKKVISPAFNQELTEPFEEEALEQEPLPGTASRIPAVLQQFPPSELAEEIEQNLESP